MWLTGGSFIWTQCEETSCGTCESDSRGSVLKCSAICHGFRRVNTSIKHHFAKFNKLFHGALSPWWGQQPNGWGRKPKPKGIAHGSLVTAARHMFCSGIHWWQMIRPRQVSRAGLTSSWLEDQAYLSQDWPIKLKSLGVRPRHQHFFLQTPHEVLMCIQSSESLQWTIWPQPSLLPPPNGSFYSSQKGPLVSLTHITSRMISMVYWACTSDQA